MKEFNKKRFKHGANLTIVTIAAIAALVVVNIILSMLGEKVQLKVDMTSNKLFQISQQTKDVLKTVEKPITVYHMGEEPPYIIRETLEIYKTHSPKLSVRNIDPDKHPGISSSYQDADFTNGAILVALDDGSRYYSISSHEMVSYDQYDMTQQGANSFKLEQQLTAAINYVSSPRSGKVYFTQGHEEQYSDSVSNILKAENYESGTITSITQGVPEDAALLFIIAPSRDFSQEEIAEIDNYVGDGGNLAVMLSPGTNVANLVNYLNDDWGVKVNDDVVIDFGSNIYGRVPLNLFPNIRPSVVTDLIVKQKRNIAFPNSRSITVGQKSGVESVTLLESSGEAIAKMITDGNVSVDTSEGDVTGVHALSVLADKTTVSGKTAKLFLSGGATFLDGELLSVDTIANADFAKTGVNHLTGESAPSVLIAPKSLKSPTILLNDTQKNLYMMAFWFAIPLLIFVSGVAVWFKRRAL